MSGQRQLENIALVGFMGTGKSSVGRQVAAQLHFQFVEHLNHFFQFAQVPFVINKLAALENLNPKV